MLSDTGVRSWRAIAHGPDGYQPESEPTRSRTIGDSGPLSAYSSGRFELRPTRNPCRQCGRQHRDQAQGHKLPSRGDADGRLRRVYKAYQRYDRKLPRHSNSVRILPPGTSENSTDRPPNSFPERLQTVGSTTVSGCCLGWKSVIWSIAGAIAAMGLSPHYRTSLEGAMDCMRW